MTFNILINGQHNCVSVKPEYYVYQDNDFIVKQGVNSPDEVDRLLREGVSNVKVDSITGNVLYVLDGKKILSEPADLGSDSGVHFL